MQKRKPARCQTMQPRNHPLSPAQSGRFQLALQQLSEKKSRSALAIARALAAEAPHSADAQQLLGMSLEECGDSPGAGQAFERARQLLPDSEVVAKNAAAWLSRKGRSREAIDLLAKFTSSPGCCTQRGLLLLKAGDVDTAVESFRQALRVAPSHAPAWRGLGSALRTKEDLGQAEQAFRQAVALAPQFGPTWVQWGAVQRLLGRVEDAMACMRRARQLGETGPEVSNAINGLLADLGDTAQALAGARALAMQHPSFVQAHETLAQMLWEYGEQEQEDPLAAFEAAVRGQPGNQPLRAAWLQTLLAASRWPEALRAAEQAQRDASASPELDWLAAEALIGMGDTVRADALFARAGRVLGEGNIAFVNARIRQAFRCGRVDEARQLAEHATQRFPGNQEAWAHLGLAWRLSSDPREFWLCDYERFVGAFEVELPPASVAAMPPLQALEQSLNRLHGAVRAPMGQSVRDGSQTSGRLFGRSDPAITAAEKALMTSIERWLGTLPEDARHPFLSRKSKTVSIVGSWSVRLWRSGRHSNHIHPQGWLSSAFYVSVPASVTRSQNETGAGWLTLGQPLDFLHDGLPPRRLIQPKPGHLVLFPSYFWHGTRPFEDDEPRLTVAFDMQPRP